MRTLSIKSSLITKNSFFIISYSLIQALVGQSYHYCGTDYAMKKFFEENPHLQKSIIENTKKLEEFTKEFIKKAQTYKTTQQIKIIPVVVHIIHNYGPENISDAQVYNAISVLNRDFRKMAADTSTIVPAFKSIAADCEIEFRLAQKDPNGNCTNGILRVVSPLTANADDNIKNLSRWPRNKYLNIWVVRDIGNPPGAAGYAYLPGSATPQVDGIVIQHSYFGEIGTSNQITGRALVHEVGHYLNLLHTWGSGPVGDPNNCNDDDFVSDTPNTIGNTSCNLNATSCNSLDNVQNFMDYSYCYRMFTQGQKLRMQAALNSSIAERNNLWQPTNLFETGVSLSPILCKADFTSNTKTLCEGADVTFQDLSYNGVISWSWSFPGGTPQSSNVQNPTISYLHKGIYDVSLTVSNGSSFKDTTKYSYIRVFPEFGIPPPYSQSFENALPNSDFFTNNITNGNFSWVITSNAASSGNKSIMVDAYNNSNFSINELYSRNIDLRPYTSATFSFKYAIAPRSSSSYAKLELYFSPDCGRTWILRWQSSGSALFTAPTSTSYFIPNPSQWVTKTFTISPTYLTGGFSYKFIVYTENSNNIYIDDINITGTYNIIPMLYSPKDGDSVPNPVEIDWLAVPIQDTYHFQVDTTPLFNSPLLMEGFKQVLYTTSDSSDTKQNLGNLVHHYTYYWRVRTIKSGTPSQWSAIWKFTVDTTISLSNSITTDYPSLLFSIYQKEKNLEIHYLGNTPLQGSIFIFDISGKNIFLEKDILFYPKATFLIKNLSPTHSLISILIVTPKNYFAKQILFQ